MVVGVSGDVRAFTPLASQPGAGVDSREAALREAMKSRKERIDELVSNPAVPREAEIKKLKSLRRTHAVLSALGGGVAGALAGATVAVVLSGAPFLAILPALMAWKTFSDAVKDGKVASYAAQKAREIESQPSRSPLQGNSQIKQIPMMAEADSPERVNLREFLAESLGSVKDLAGEIQWKSSYKSGVAGVWNPKTEQVEWKSSYKSGVAGVWNPRTEQVEWKSSYKSGVAGVSTYRDAPTLASASFYGDDE